MESDAITEDDRRKLRGLKVPIPKKEEDRLLVLRQCNLLDTQADESFDRFTSLCARLFKMPIVLVSLVDADRQWFKSRFGLAAQETHRDVAFCAYTILEETPRVMVVPDAQLDARFKANPLVIGPPYIRFYGGASIIVQGQKVGTLCLIDSAPRGDFSVDDEATLIHIADTIATMMEERRRMRIDQYLNGVQMHQSLLTLLAQQLRGLTAAVDEARRHWQQAKESAKTCGLRGDAMAAVQRDAEELQRCTERVSLFLDASLRFVTRAIAHPAASHEPTPRLTTPQTCPLNALLPLHVDRWLQSVSDLVVCPSDVACSTNLVAYDQSPLYTHPDVLSVLTAALVQAIAQSPVFVTERVVFFYDAAAEALNVSIVVDHRPPNEPSTVVAAVPSLETLLRDASAAAGSPLGRVLQAAETLLAWVGGRLQCHHSDQQQWLLLSVYATSKKPPAVGDTFAVLQGLSWKPPITVTTMKELTLPLRPNASSHRSPRDLPSVHGPAPPQPQPQPQSMERATPSDGDLTPPSMSLRVKPTPSGSRRPPIAAAAAAAATAASAPNTSRRTSHSSQGAVDEASSLRLKPSPCEGDSHRQAVRSFAEQWVAQWRPPWVRWSLWPGATVHPVAALQ